MLWKISTKTHWPPPTNKINNTTTTNQQNPPHLATTNQQNHHKKKKTKKKKKKKEAHQRPPQTNQEREPPTWLEALSVRIFSNFGNNLASLVGSESGAASIAEAWHSAASIYACKSYSLKRASMQENGSFHASGSDRESVSRIGEDRQEKTQGGWAGETREGGGSFCARETKGNEGLSCVREFCRGRRGFVALCERDKRFWKMIYKKCERKPFSKILHYIFQSTENIFSLTKFYKQTNIRKCWKCFPKNILQRNKWSLSESFFFQTKPFLTILFVQWLPNWFMNKS